MAERPQLDWGSSREAPLKQKCGSSVIMCPPQGGCSVPNSPRFKMTDDISGLTLIAL